MNQKVVFGGLYVLLSGGFLTVVHAGWHAAGTGGHLLGGVGPLPSYGILVVGALVAIAGTWAKGG